MIDETLIWPVRTFIYQHFAATARAPQSTEIAQHFGLGSEETGAVLSALHEIHALFLDSNGAIRIANPFSAVPTPFEVDVHGMTYWANCAWDSFGVIAALQAPEGVIRSHCTQSGTPLYVQVQHGEVADTAAMIHVLVPFQQWYEDMVFT